MDIRIVIFLLYGASVVTCFHAVKYHFIENSMTWTDAQQYCRQHYTDLATFWSLEDVYRVETPRGFDKVWIGLFDDPASWMGMGNNSNSWRWSATGTTSPGGFHKWKSGQPNYSYGQEQCVSIQNGVWYDIPCISEHPAVCFSGSIESGKKNYTFISTTMTQEQALSHCRQHYTDLAMIENESENTAVASVITVDGHVWIGLYREPWRWSDGSQSKFTHWKPGSPNNDQNRQHCAMEINQPDKLWNDMVCTLKKPFICQQAVHKESRLLMKLRSGVDLSKSGIHNQISQQVAAELERRGITGVNLKWKI